MATRSRRNPPADPNVPAGPAKAGGAPRRARRTAHPEPTNAEVAREAAAIYPDTADTPPTPDEIAEEAYAIYRERGGTHGQDMNDWLEAERRVSARRKSSGSTGSTR